MKTSFLFIGLLLWVSTVFGQTTPLLSDEELEKQPTYHSLEEALKEPEKVYKLDLRGRNSSLFHRLDFIGKSPILFDVIEKCINLQHLKLSQNQLDISSCGK